MSRVALVVDDDPFARKLVGLALEAAGLRSEEAVGIADAERRLRGERFDLLMLDGRLADGSAREAMSRWRGLGLPLPPVVLVSAWGDDAPIPGVVAHCTKPLRVEEVLASLPTWLAAGA